MARQGIRVAGDEVLAVAHAHDQRAPQPGGHEHVGPLAEEHEQAVGAAQLGDRLPHRHHPGRIGGIVGHASARGERAAEAAVDEMGDHLR
ncbi:MAG: hypothetical protein ACKOWG_20680, partial [Planctomycetia bacterium]